MIMSGSLIIWQTSSNEYKNMKKELEQNANLIKHYIDDEANPDEIGNSLKQFIETNSNVYYDKKIYLLDKKGDIVFPNSEKLATDSFYYPQVMGALYGDKTDKLDSVHLDGAAVEYRGFASAVYYEDKVEYVVYILASTEKIKSMLQDIVQVIVLVMILAIAMAGVLGYLFSGFLTKPISILTKKAKDMAAGHLDDPIRLYSNDEIGQLTDNFNTMAASLKDTLEQISGEKNKLEIVFSHMTDGILVFDKDGVLTHYNPASVDMLKITAQKTYKDVFSEYSEVPYRTIFNKVMNDAVQHIIKVGARYYNLCLAKFLSQSETQVGMICVIQDITEHKKLEEMQKEFVANVSHELRTPLTTIKSYTETLLDGALNEKDVAMNFLNVINYEGDRMTALVQDLLDLSKLDNKQTTFIMEELNLNMLLEESIEKYQIHADKKSQKLNYHPSKAVYKVVGDANRIEQVIKNIISNAVKYSPEDSTTDVNIYEQENYAIIKIQDTGFGIPEEDVPRIFERFYRVDKARSREMGGTGLGLSIAKEIMEYHGGQITFTSIFGKGTCFFLSFPMVSVRK
jgi:two-component system sensor histidine kinase VicK